MAPLISIHTPSWNRANYLERVWTALSCQTFKDFEWIVSDDGSTDDTKKVLEQLKLKSSFPIVIVTASSRVGKSVLDNNAIKIARGEFFILHDSDDVLFLNALEVLVSTWESIPESNRDEFVGVTAFCKTEDGLLSQGLPFHGVFDTTWNDLEYVYGVKGDKLLYMKTNLLRTVTFPEVDYYIPESVVLTKLGSKFKTRVTPEVVMLKEYRTNNAISFSKELRYCRGYAYSLAIIRQNLIGSHFKLWELINFLRYSMHGEIPASDCVKLWNRTVPIFYFILVLPITFLLVLKDNLEGKVRKTHRDFIVSRREAVLTVTS